MSSMRLGVDGDAGVREPAHRPSRCGDQLPHLAAHPLQREAEEGSTCEWEKPMVIKATAWRRYGKDRTYLHDDELPLGWVDNVTGDIHVESEELRETITRWLAVTPGAEPEVDVGGTAGDQPLGDPDADGVANFEAEHFELPAVPSEPSQSHAEVGMQERDWEDLALRHPGQAVREQAKAELSTMWEESKFRTVLRIAFDSKTDERAWRMGASGEETIGAKLEKLSGDGWRVLHSVPIGERGSDVDHIVIGPGGVWTINAKNHPGKKIWVAPRQIRVDGHAVPYLRNSEFEANRVRKILLAQLGWEPYVRAALVFMTGTLVPEVTIKGKPEHVDILDRMDVNRRLKREPVRMTAEQVDEVFEIARRSTTWVR
jgi:hypothetical protein